jgi:MFS family permease
VVGACIVLVFTGVTFSLYASQSNSSLQMIVPDRLRGRVLSLYAYVFFGTAPLGGLFTGWISGRFGTGLFLLIVGGVSVLAAVAGVIWARVRRTTLPTRRSRPGLDRADPTAVIARE